jgi:hypothetical protein
MKKDRDPRFDFTAHQMFSLVFCELGEPEVSEEGLKGHTAESTSQWRCAINPWGFYTLYTVYSKGI